MKMSRRDMLLPASVPADIETAMIGLRGNVAEAHRIFAAGFADSGTNRCAFRFINFHCIHPRSCRGMQSINVAIHAWCMITVVDQHSRPRRCWWSGIRFDRAPYSPAGSPFFFRTLVIASSLTIRLVRCMREAKLPLGRCIEEYPALPFVSNLKVLILLGY